MRRHADPIRHARPSRAIAAAVLAVPVVAWIYVSALARRWPAARPATLVAVLITGSIGMAGAPTTGARPLTPVDAIERGVFRPVDIPATGASNVVPRPGRPGPDRLPAEVVTAPRPAAPAVVRFRPRHGWVGVSRLSAVSVRFSRPMDRASTKSAFRAEVEGRRVVGTYRWAEGDTVLVLTPATPLPLGARIRLSVADTARSADDLPLAAPRTVTFSVVPRPEPPSAPAAPAPSVSWQWPLIGPITQRFGESLTKYGRHNGIDIDGQTGDPVRAARGGRIIVAGRYDDCGGLDVHIDHGGGFVSWYRHLSSIDVGVGSWVRAGRLIGRVGDTGCSLGSHLHFGIQRRGTFIDPLRYLPRR